MIETGFVLKVIVIPSIALILPLLILSYHILSNDLQLTIDRITGLKFIMFWMILSILIFLLLIYFTGDLGYFYYLKPGITSFEGGLQFNFSEHIGLTFRYDPGINLLVIAMLSSILYTALFILPPVCTYNPDTKPISPEKTKTSTAASLSGGVTSAFSAIASTTVCCSTSIFAVVAPGLTALLGPFVPILLYLSMALLIYSFVKIVIPRFPVS